MSGRTGLAQDAAPAASRPGDPGARRQAAGQADHGLGRQARQAAALCGAEQAGLSPGRCAGQAQGQARAGRQEVFSSRDAIGEWISMAPGEKTKTQFYADDRVFWVVESGSMKVTIEGQEPFIATKHFLVQVPKRLQYSMETVGDRAGACASRCGPPAKSPDYPLSETPTPVKGVHLCPGDLYRPWRLRQDQPSLYRFRKADRAGRREDRRVDPR